MSRPDRTPVVRRVWNREGDRAARATAAILAPAEIGFRAVVAFRNWLYNNKLIPSVPGAIEVISIGNITVGGTGKTPFAAWLAERFADAGRVPAIVHGGYAPDEPELHRTWRPDTPVIVNRDRIAAVRRAAEAGADVAILDDGFQHRRIDRTADIVLVSAETGLSDVRLLPRGPFREPVSSLGRATAVVVTRKAASAERAAEVATVAARTVGEDRVVVVSIEPAGWRGGGGDVSQPEGRALAVAALAEPETFAENAISAGARVGGTLWFRDHHEYTVEDAKRILESSHGGPVVTTAKDAVKLKALLPPTRYWVLEQRVVVESGATVLDRIVGGGGR